MVSEVVCILDIMTVALQTEIKELAFKDLFQKDHGDATCGAYDVLFLHHKKFQNRGKH